MTLLLILRLGPERTLSPTNRLEESTSGPRCSCGAMPLQLDKLIEVLCNIFQGLIKYLLSIRFILLSFVLVSSGKVFNRNLLKEMRNNWDRLGITATDNGTKDEAIAVGCPLLLEEDSFAFVLSSFFIQLN